MDRPAILGFFILTTLAGAIGLGVARGRRALLLSPLVGVLAVLLLGVASVVFGEEYTVVNRRRQVAADLAELRDPLFECARKPGCSMREVCKGRLSNVAIVTAGRQDDLANGFHPEVPKELGELGKDGVLMVVSRGLGARGLDYWLVYPKAIVRAELAEDIPGM